VELPDQVKSLVSESEIASFRNSLTHEQNDAVRLAARLAALEDGGGRGGYGEGDGGEPKKQGVISADRANKIRAKIRIAGKILRMQKTIRQQHEQALTMGGHQHLQQALGTLAEDGTTTAEELFERAKHADNKFEKTNNPLATKGQMAAAAKGGAPGGEGMPPP